jgi:predicted aldo/keto reductase-like oxidoreductase
MDRRDFLKCATLATSAAAWPSLGRQLSAAEPQQDAVPVTAPPREERLGDMLYRRLGRTNERVSVIGLGGYHIARPKDEQESIRIIRTAIDRGITFMDNCWDYHDGGSERRMGTALRDGYRDKVFLMTKIDGRTRQAAARQTDECLRRLQTDRIDLMQHHEIIRMEDPDRIFSEGGAHEALLAAQKAGKIRYLGFTGHKDPIVHLRMLDIAARHGVRFDAVQMPLNAMDAHFRSFAKDVLPRLVRDEIGVLGMKPLGGGLLLASKTVTAAECLQYALSLPASLVITGIDSMPILEQALDVVKAFKPLTEAQVKDLLARTAQPAATGKYELFKTNNTFDGTAHHPEWLG